MIRRARLRIWLIAFDLACALRLPLSAKSWLFQRAASSVHYEPLEPDGGDGPF